MRRFMMSFGSTMVVLGSSLIAAGQDKAPAQAPEKQSPAPAQAPVQAPEKQAPVQGPTQKIAPVQKPVQAPTQKYTCGQCQSPVQKGAEPYKTARVVMFGRYR
jgi:DMSO/TMAO reductase YedYZ molybdopterin-dependent catalytic subunit